MHRYYKKKDTFIVTLITGPAHVYLGLEFNPNCSAGLPEITVAKSGPDEAKSSLDEGQILQSVLTGISSANNRFNTKMHVSKIEYVESDTPRYDLFEQCAFLIVEGIATNQEFVEIYGNDRP